MPKGEHLLVMMDANARAGRRGEGCVDGKMLGAYGRNTLNDNGRRLLLTFSAENQLALVNTYFSAPKRGIPYTFQSPNTEEIATARIMSSRGKQTDDSYEMSLCADLL